MVCHLLPFATGKVRGMGRAELMSGRFGQRDKERVLGLLSGGLRGPVVMQVSVSDRIVWKGIRGPGVDNREIYMQAPVDGWKVTPQSYTDCTTENGTVLM